MGGKRNTGRKPRLAGLKWMLAALSVAGTLGLWQVFGDAQAQDSDVKASGAVSSQVPQDGLDRMVAGIPGSFDKFPAGVPVKIVLDGAQAPRPLAVTRSS